MAMIFPFLVVGFVFASDVVNYNVARKEATLIAQASADAGASQFILVDAVDGDPSKGQKSVIEGFEASEIACETFKTAVNNSETQRLRLERTGKATGPGCTSGYSLAASVSSTETATSVEVTYQPRSLFVLRFFISEDLSVGATAHRCDAAGGTTGSFTNAASFAHNSCAAPVFFE